MKKYSREAFDRAQADVNKSLQDSAKENAERTAEEDMALPYNLLPSDVAYSRAAKRRDLLADQAEAEARRLEAKHRSLLRAVEVAKKALVEFETKELDMHKAILGS
jgi:hypothetical protein